MERNVFEVQMQFGPRIQAGGFVVDDEQARAAVERAANQMAQHFLMFARIAADERNAIGLRHVAQRRHGAEVQRRHFALQQRHFAAFQNVLEETGKRRERFRREPRRRHAGDQMRLAEFLRHARQRLVPSRGGLRAVAFDERLQNPRRFRLHDFKPARRAEQSAVRARPNRLRRGADGCRA